MNEKENKITAYKGFDKDLKCRGFQYEVGGEYEHDGKVKACSGGFHACERPLDVFRFYGPRGSRYCVVEQSGDMDTDGESTKVASKKIKIGAEIGIPGLVKAQIEYVKAHTTSEHTDPDKATAGKYGAATAGDYGAATAGYSGAAAAGYSGAATAGYRGAATAGDSGAATAGKYGAATAGDSGAATAGYSGAATAGYRGAATAGNYGAATAGDYGAATAGDSGAAAAGDRGFALSGGTAECGENGVAVAHGEDPKAKGGVGAVLVLAKTDGVGTPVCVKTVTVNGRAYKPDVWYTIKDGKVVKADGE